MENTLFGSNRTKLTGRTNDFNLDTGLYEAMYEQSQMELKILEAMVKADSLSRKYRASGMYTESTIQAFNEEAKTKIGIAVNKLIEAIKGRITKWWKAFKDWATGILDKIKRKIDERKAKRTQNKADAANRAKMDDIIDKNLHVEVEWPAKNIDWVKMASSMYDFIVTEYSDDKIQARVNDIKKATKAGKDPGPDEIINRINDKGAKYLNVTSDINSFFTKKTLGDLPEIKGGGLEKIINDKKAQLNKMDSIIDNCKKKLDEFKQDADTIDEDIIYRNYMMYVSSASKILNDAMGSIQTVARKELAAYVEVSTRINTIQFENATLYVEAAMYEAFMAPSTSDNYNLYSAEDIKRFAAAKLEAAMDEISDVIDQAIGSNNAQGIENVNLAGTDVLGAGVSNDPNRLVYDDDCYSQGGTFGDENIAGYVDTNIAGTSTSVAKGNETKAAMEGFLFNW